MEKEKKKRKAVNMCVATNSMKRRLIQMVEESYTFYRLHWHEQSDNKQTKGEKKEEMK